MLAVELQATRGGNCGAKVLSRRLDLGMSASALFEALRRRGFTHEPLTVQTHALAAPLANKAQGTWALQYPLNSLPTYPGANSEHPANHYSTLTGSVRLDPTRTRGGSPRPQHTPKKNCGYHGHLFL